MFLDKLWNIKKRNQFENVPCEIVEVVHDDGHEQVEDQEGTNDEETNKDLKHRKSASSVQKNPQDK